MLTGEAPLTQTAFLRIAAALLFVHAAMLAALAWVTPVTVDEPGYLLAGQLLGGTLSWESYLTFLHGPLPYYANQIFGPQAQVADPGASFWFSGRLGLLSFSLLAAVVLTVLTRAAFGPVAALFALGLHCLNPIVLAHGSLMTTDMSLVGFWLLTLLLTWEYTARPRTSTLLGIGATLGVALATKYLALMLIPILGLCLVIALARGMRPDHVLRKHAAAPWHRPVNVAFAVAACAATAWVMLWACYLFVPPGFEAERTSTMSQFIPALLELPAGSAVLGALPEPWVRGVDVMKGLAESGGTSYLLGHASSTGHWDYYLVSLLTKMPLVVLALIPFGVFAWRHDWPRGLRPVVYLGIGVPLVYLSLFQALQIGVRHMLQVIPLLSLLAAVPLAGVWQRGLFGNLKHGRLTVAGCALVLLVCHAATWPNYIGAFNSVVGDRPYLWFRDSNLTWQPGTDDRDVNLLRQRHPDAERVFALSGPRFGKIVAWAPDLCLYPRVGPSTHWLLSFPPVDSSGAWYVFDVSEDEYRRIVEDGDNDARDRVYLTAALATSGRIAEASAALASSGERDPAIAEFNDALTSALAQAEAGQWTEDPRLSLQRLGRHDLVVADASGPAFIRAKSQLIRGDAVGARDMLLGIENQRPLAPREALILSAVYVSEGNRAEALAVLDRYQPPPDDPLAPFFASARTVIVPILEHVLNAEEHLQRMLRLQRQ